MPTFDVRYSFTCPVCLQPNAGREEIVADDNVAARERTVVASCSYCDRKLPPNYFVRRNIQEKLS